MTNHLPEGHMWIEYEGQRGHRPYFIDADGKQAPMCYPEETWERKPDGSVIVHPEP